MTVSIKDFGLTCGSLPAGMLNGITDVSGVQVGHVTLRDGDINTGVTAILPHGGNLFRNKVRAASEVVNGFGKTIGLVQLDELGTIETPLLLTNTLSVGICATALIRQAIRQNPDIGRRTGTVNPLVAECNDGPLNDIQALAVSEAHALAAIEAASEGAVEQGSVGAGTGMTCFGFKGASVPRLGASYSMATIIILAHSCSQTLAGQAISSCPTVVVPILAGRPKPRAGR